MHASNTFKFVGDIGGGCGGGGGGGGCNSRSSSNGVQCRNAFDKRMNSVYNKAAYFIYNIQYLLHSLVCIFGDPCLKYTHTDTDIIYMLHEM